MNSVDSTSTAGQQGWRRRVAATTIVAVGMVVTGCGGDASSSDRDAADRSVVTTPSASDGDEPYGDAGLRELNDASRLTVVGTVVSSQHDVEIGFVENFDPAEFGVTDPMTQAYTVYEIRVDDVIRGSYDEPTMSVAFLTALGGNPVGAPEKSAVPNGTRGVWLLNPIADDFDLEGFVLTGTSSAITQTGDGRLTISGDSETLARELSGYESIDEVAKDLRR